MATGKCQCPDNPFVGPLLVLCILLGLFCLARVTSEPPIIVAPPHHTVYHCEKYQNIEVQK
uniref:Movement protein 2 n=1 Tax=Maize mild mottle virus TaxID=2931827 RepID=A0A8T9JCH1_9VIRU|nr:movement protein 2 [Maize mild mottle virus]